MCQRKALLLPLLLVLPTLAWAHGRSSVERATYLYDRAGRLVEVSYEGGARITYEWDENDNLLRKEVRGQLIYQDDFESADLGSWSSSSP